MCKVGENGTRHARSNAISPLTQVRTLDPSADEEVDIQRDSMRTARDTNGGASTTTKTQGAEIYLHLNSRGKHKSCRSWWSCKDRSEEGGRRTQRTTLRESPSRGAQRTAPGGRAKIAVKKAAGAHNEPLSVNLSSP
jgi:hypothetical protein